jgi:predicted Holliday junction resolvase-like endonuclease
MNLVEKIFAATIVVICVLLLLRMVLRPRRRARVDASLKKRAALWQRRVQRAILWPAAELRARRETKEAIRRARRSAIEREGNVISPKAFKGRRRDLH